MKLYVSTKRRRADLKLILRSYALTNTLSKVLSLLRLSENNLYNKLLSMNKKIDPLEDLPVSVDNAGLIPLINVFLVSTLADFYNLEVDDGGQKSVAHPTWLIHKECEPRHFGHFQSWR